MIIDAHSHMINSDMFDEMSEISVNGVDDVVDYFDYAGNKWPAMMDLSKRIEQLERTEIDLQVITPPYAADCNLLPAEPEGQLEYARLVNDGMSELVEASGGRLLGIGTIPLESIDRGGREEMERALETLDLRGFSVSTHFHGRSVDDADFEAFWAAANDLESPIFLHPVDPLSVEGRPYESDYDLTHVFGWPYETTLALSRLVFSGVMERYPNLQIVGHHVGGMIPFFLGRTMEHFRSSRPDPDALDPSTSLAEYFSRFYYDTAIGGHAPAIRCGYETFGADRIIFATDAPYGPGNGPDRMLGYPDVVRSLGLADEDQDRIFSENTQSLLWIDT